MNAQAAIELIRQIGVWGLSDASGCDCAEFEIQGVTVDISCHKSEHCVRVWSHHVERSARGLAEVAAEVLRQLGERASLDGYRLRFCEYRMDHHNGHWENGVWVESYLCCFCGFPREEREEYLCSKCRTVDPDATALYPWTKDGFRVSSFWECAKCGDSNSKEYSVCHGCGTARSKEQKQGDE